MTALSVAFPTTACCLLSISPSHFLFASLLSSWCLYLCSALTAPLDYVQAVCHSPQLVLAGNEHATPVRFQTYCEYFTLQLPYASTQLALARNYFEATRTSFRSTACQHLKVVRLYNIFQRCIVSARSRSLNITHGTVLHDVGIPRKTKSASIPRLGSLTCL